jgi:hypothetical protein
LRLHPLFVHVLGFGVAAATLGKAIAGRAVADAHHDSMEPGAKLRPAREGRQAFVQLKEAFLHEVFGILRPSGCPDHKGEDIPTVASVKFEKCTVVSLSGLFGENFVADCHAR